MMTLLFANSIMIINISVQANDFTVWLNEEFDAFLVGETVTFIVVLLYIYALKWSQIYKAQTMNQSKFFFLENFLIFNTIVTLQFHVLAQPVWVRALVC